MAQGIMRRWPHVSIVILNWNGWQDTIECLESIRQISYPEYDVILVDNGSSDQSVAMICEYCKGFFQMRFQDFECSPSGNSIKTVHQDPSNFKTENEDSTLAPHTFETKRSLVLLQSHTNLGYAGGNNIGATYALRTLKPDYLLFLNNDAVVDKDFLGPLVLLGESDPRIGMIGPKICYYDHHEIVWAAGGKANLFTGNIGNIGEGKRKDSFSGTMKVSYVTGCAILLKREVLETVGLFYPGYFCYFEETDLAFRARRHGYISVVDNDVTILHKSAASIRKTSGLNYYYFSRNKLLFMKRNARLFHLMTFTILFIAGQSTLILYYLVSGQLTICRSIGEGMLDFVLNKHGKHDSH